MSAPVIVTVPVLASLVYAQQEGFAPLLKEAKASIATIACACSLTTSLHMKSML
jgi:hypothetical protein